MHILSLTSQVSPFILPCLHVVQIFHIKKIIDRFSCVYPGILPKRACNSRKYLDVWLPGRNPDTCAFASSFCEGGISPPDTITFRRRRRFRLPPAFLAAPFFTYFLPPFLFRFPLPSCCFFLKNDRKAACFFRLTIFTDFQKFLFFTILANV